MKFDSANSENFPRTDCMFNEADLISAQKLAYFLVSCPKSYLLIVLDSAERAVTQSRRQEDHFAEPPQYRPTCVNWRPKHLLQLWICETAKKYERNYWPQEDINDETDARRQQTLVIRFIRDVVTWRMVELSTFHASVGMTEILHSYDRSLQDLPEYYRIRLELDPEDEKKTPSYFRRCYGALLKYLTSPERFGSLIKIEKYGAKNRICSRTDSNSFDSLVREILRDFFTLWDTLHPNESALEKSYYYGNSITNHSAAETIRAHRLLCPDCFLEITSVLKICEPVKRLQIPQFLMSDDFYKGPPAGDKLSDDEASSNLSLLSSSLEGKAKRRAEYTPGLVSYFADGVNIGERDLVVSRKGAFRLNTEQRLFEIRSNDGLLLATHFIPYDEIEEKLQLGNWTVQLENGQQFLFAIDGKSLRGSGSFEIATEYKETHYKRAIAFTLKQFSRKIHIFLEKLLIKDPRITIFVTLSIFLFFLAFLLSNQLYQKENVQISYERKTADTEDSKTPCTYCGQKEILKDEKSETESNKKNAHGHNSTQQKGKSSNKQSPLRPASLSSLRPNLPRSPAMEEPSPLPPPSTGKRAPRQTLGLSQELEESVILEVKISARPAPYSYIFHEENIIVLFLLKLSQPAKSLRVILSTENYRARSTTIISNSGERLEQLIVPIANAQGTFKYEINVSDRVLITGEGDFRQLLKK